MEHMSGGALVTAAALLALQVAEGRTEEQLDVLAAFFTAFADNLALISGRTPQSV